MNHKISRRVRKLKIKLRKVLPRLLALFLILTMMLTPNVIEVLADGESGTGSTNPNYKGDPGTFEYDKNLSAVFKPAWLVYIQKVANTCDGTAIFDYSATNDYFASGAPELSFA